MIDRFVSLLNQWARLRFFWRRMGLQIPREALVLDIGSGDNPHGRADLLCDRDVASHHDRPGILHLDRPFVVGDAECLPFRDDAFDYIISSHVLEHTERPDRVLGELMRVGRAGYIETPSTFSEKLGGMITHRWTTDLANGVLLVQRKARPTFDEQLHFTFHRLWQAGAPAFMFFYWQNLPLFYTRLEWRGQIPYRLVEADTDPHPSSFMGEGPGVRAAPHEHPLPDLDALAHLRPTPTSLKWAAKRLLYRVAGQWHPRRTLDLPTILACPLCRGPLRLEARSAFCTACAATFPVVNDIPVLLPEAKLS